MVNVIPRGAGKGHPHGGLQGEENGPKVPERGDK